jgi:DNA sulfur modification protein DndD
MHLERVQLRNWRSYRAAEFRFLPRTGKKNVILIGAMNGNGKTSLLHALYLGLFGRETMPFFEGVSLGANDEERVRSYRHLLQRTLHRPALDDPQPKASVGLTFADTKRSVSVSRTWYFRPGGMPRDLSSTDGEETRIEVDGRVQRVADWQDANNIITRLLFPSNVLPCFFFDGEQAQKRVEAAGTRAVTDAVHALYGTAVLRELRTSLRTYVTAQRQAVKRDVGDVREEELERKRMRRDELEGDVTRIAAEQRSVTAMLAEKIESRQQTIRELTQVTGDATIDLQQLAQLEGDLRHVLCEGLAELALPMALRRWGPTLRTQLEAEEVRDRWLIVRDETRARAETIIALALPRETGLTIPPLTETQRDMLELRLRTALESLWSPPPQGCATDWLHKFLGASDRTAALLRLKALEGFRKSDVASIAGEWSEAHRRVGDLHRQWDSLRDLEPRMTEIRRRITELDSEIQQLTSRKSSLDTADKGHRSELADVKAAIGQMEQLQRQMGPVAQRLEIAERVREVIDDGVDELAKACKDALERACTKHFRHMITSEYQRHAVSFDDEQQPVLRLGKAEPVYVSTLSGAQKRVFGLAFTLAVADVSGETLPLVIDTPVGNLDSEYRTRILEYLAQTAAGQVIFLSHDEEISAEYVDVLKPYLLQKYLVNFEAISDGSGVSTIEADRYFAA